MASSIGCHNRVRRTLAALALAALALSCGGNAEKAGGPGRGVLGEAPNDLPWVVRVDKAAPRDAEGYAIANRRDDGDTDLPRMREGGVGAQF
ncbi:MAG: dipeptidase [Polyangiaceae bacterium]|jgi:membrane dipeptidase|nr:dipeptidase [Polyangiaceae bacterium]